ncbi:MAG: hypothetical protein EBS97_09975, partial [Verrucomicrobia bacterium]|nr:hypothetical protein [Verrucomicrobiota bacterium]
MPDEPFRQLWYAAALRSLEGLKVEQLEPTPNLARSLSAVVDGQGARLFAVKIQPGYKLVLGINGTNLMQMTVFGAGGEVLDQKMCNDLSLKHNLILLCGHYKGIDQRIRDVLVTREISIGDYVLTGGEIAAGVLTDAIVRLVPGVVSDAESVLEDSFMHNLLDAPHYTKPAVFRDHHVPDVLLSGNHARIREWRQEQSLAKTRVRRP